MGRTDYNYARLDNFFTVRLFARYQVTDNVALHVRVETCSTRISSSRMTITSDRARPGGWESSAA